MTLEEAVKELGKANVNLNVGIVYPSPSALIDEILITPTLTPTQSPTPAGSSTPVPETESPAPGTETPAPAPGTASPGRRHVRSRTHPE